MNESDGKRCGRCGVLKPLCEFTPKAKGRQSYCRSCVRTYSQEYYRKNKDAYVARATQHHRKLRVLIQQAKGRPCADCGKSYPYYVMEFDHREGEEKLCNVADLNCHRRVSMRTLMAEIAKCDLVCANCHRERTYRRHWSSGKLNTLL